MLPKDCGLPKDEGFSKDPALLHMDTTLFVRGTRAVLDIVEDALVFEGSCGLWDLGLSGPLVRGADGTAADRDLLEVAQEVMSHCCVEGLLEGNSCFAKSGLVLPVTAVGAAAPFALSFALPNMVLGNVYRNAAKHG